MTEQKTLLLKYGTGDYHWTAEEIENVMDAIEDKVGDDVSIMAVPDGIEFLNESEVQNVVNELISAVEEDTEE